MNKESILESVSIVDFLNFEGISVDEVGASEFDFRCKCPSIQHKNGYERTPSCYISSAQKHYWCFGCSISGNVIDMCIHMKGFDFSDAMRYLCENFEIHTVCVEKKRKPNNFKILLEISEIFHMWMLQNTDNLKMCSDFMQKADKYILALKSDDIENAELLKERIREEIASNKFSREPHENT